MDNFHSIILLASLRQKLVWESTKFMGGNGKILVRCRGNFALIVGGSGGNLACAVGEIAILAWQPCIDAAPLLYFVMN